MNHPFVNEYFYGLQERNGKDTARVAAGLLQYYVTVFDYEDMGK